MRSAGKPEAALTPTLPVSDSKPIMQHLKRRPALLRQLVRGAESRVTRIRCASNAILNPMGYAPCYFYAHKYMKNKN
jgi:hypothetical protein